MTNRLCKWCGKNFNNATVHHFWVCCSLDCEYKHCVRNALEFGGDGILSRSVLEREERKHDVRVRANM